MLNLCCSVESVKATLQWRFSTSSNDEMKFAYRLKIVDISKSTVQMERFSSNQTGTVIKLDPGCWYSINLQVVCDHRIISQTDVQFKAVFNYHEICTLLSKANRFIRDEIFGTDMHEISIFYRTKPEHYWREIQNDDGVMRPYIKDSTGHPGSAINEKINGLFFSGRLFNGRLPMASPYGNKRFKIPCQKLFLPGRHNMYFCDFYCNNTRHYVTLAICVQESDVDRYCSSRLHRLDPFDNLFLKLQEFNSYDYKYFINNNIWVEILYTSDIRLWWGEFDEVFPLGQSDPDGIPNNKVCKTCNLYASS